MAEITCYIQRAASLMKLAETDSFSASIEAGKLMKEVWAEPLNGYQISELRSVVHAFQDAIEKMHKQLERCE